MNSLFLCGLFIGTICHVASAAKSPPKLRCGFCLDTEVKNLVRQMDYEGILLRKEKAPVCGNDAQYTRECDSGCFELTVTQPNGTNVGRMQDCQIVVYHSPYRNAHPHGLNQIQKMNGKSGNLYTFDFKSRQSCEFCSNGAISWENKERALIGHATEDSPNKHVYYGISIGVLGMFFSYIAIYVTARMYCSRRNVAEGIPNIAEVTEV